MVFPETHVTLIQRLASGGSEEDWGRFLCDYWGPICRFSLRWGVGTMEDAEDVASQTFEVLWEKQLLVRWLSHRSAKLRTLLCTVVRNILSNRHRVQAGRARLTHGLIERINELAEAQDEQADAFYAAWVEDLIQRAVESLVAEYYRKGKGDYVRVMYSRLCEGMSVVDVAESLRVKPTDVVNYFRHARQRLSKTLEQLLRDQVGRYCRSTEAEEEFALEWQHLGEHLSESGGLEAAVRRAYELLDPVQAKKRRETGLSQAVTRLTSIIRTPPEANSSHNQT
jgi:RNA polymerase sigma factor (sigma-70 family)